MYAAIETAAPEQPELLLEFLEHGKTELFPLGQTVCTRNASAWAQANLPPKLLEEDLWLNILIRAHVTGCWDDLPDEDRRENLRALKQGSEGRIFSVYTVLNQKIYVITEWNRSLTTVLLDDDY